MIDSVPKEPLVVPERREGEDLTEFIMRGVCNEIIEQCARAAERAWPLDGHQIVSENSNVYLGQDHAARTIFKAIRGLKR